MASTSQQRRSSFMMLLTVAHQSALVLVLSLVQETSEFHLWVRNHKDKRSIYPGDGKASLWSYFYSLCR